MTSNQKKLITLILGGLFVFTITYFEGDGFEIHRLIVGLIGITEGLLFARGLEKFDNYATINNWMNGQKLVRKVLFCFGLLAIMITVDRLINYTLATYNRDYKIIWTIIIPGTIVIAQLFKLLDFWAAENEKKDSTRTRL
jgi:ABC-type antimicrobial peptide transport system permease subunit